MRVCTANQLQAEDDLHLLSQLYSQPELSTVSLAAAALLLSGVFLWPPTASASRTCS